ncbi:unnamed protein product [Rotaria sp. Silwood1]|nr:unnamed protein product [Rotaria sp. Silwood1]CAF3667391.1 unnamed protein product [Rotaria sp. Silwood1]CAF3691015.1 unnamed protein product [Rotaria sp. Silwood1]CAF4544524.1 unnamed protein product [Rotaria sp. Silwood1]CAF4677458.1 unnamed protein product [Rotaria sp. Silwood1]
MSDEFIESTHGKTQLCSLGYRYCFKHKNQNGSEYWVCVKCTASATSYSDLSVVARDEHTYLSDETDKIALEISNDLLINLPSINTLKKNLHKQRRKTRPPVPRKIEQLLLPLPDVYCKTTQGDWFFVI